MAQTSKDAMQADITRYGNLPKPLKVIIIILTIFGIAIFIYHVFDWRILGWVLRGVRYYYRIYACFTTCVFLTLPMRKTDRHKTKIPWYDLVFAALVHFPSHRRSAVRAPGIWLEQPAAKKDLSSPLRWRVTRVPPL